MKHNIPRTAFSLATLFLCLTPAMQAQVDNHCSTAKAAGQWGFTLTGTLNPGAETPRQLPRSGDSGISAFAS